MQRAGTRQNIHDKVNSMSKNSQARKKNVFLGTLGYGAKVLYNKMTIGSGITLTWN